MPQVPSKRYDLFIKFFEKEVAKKQEEIEKLRKVEPLYNIAKAALEKHSFDNDIKIINMAPNLRITIIAKEDTHYVDFVPLAEDICARMIEMKLRDTKINFGIERHNAWTWGYTIASVRLLAYIEVLMLFPWEGNKYLKIEKKKITREDMEFVTTWTDKE